MKKIVRIPTIALMAFILFFATVTFAQNNHVTKIRKNQRGVIKSVEFFNTDIDSVPRSANDFFTQYLRKPVEIDFIKTPHKSDNDGQLHEHYDQYYKGIKVVDGGYNFHFKNGKMFYAPAIARLHRVV